MPPRWNRLLRQWLGPCRSPWRVPPAPWPSPWDAARPDAALRTLCPAQRRSRRVDPPSSPQRTLSPSPASTRGSIAAARSAPAPWALPLRLQIPVLQIRLLQMQMRQMRLLQLGRPAGSQRESSPSPCRAPCEAGRRMNCRWHDGGLQRRRPPAAPGPAAIVCRRAASFRRMRRHPIVSKPLIDGLAWRRQHSRRRQRPIGRRRHWRSCQPRLRLRSRPRAGRMFG